MRIIYYKIIVLIQGDLIVIFHLKFYKGHTGIGKLLCYGVSAASLLCCIVAQSANAWWKGAMPVATESHKNNEMLSDSQFITPYAKKKSKTNTHVAVGILPAKREANTDINYQEAIALHTAINVNTATAAELAENLYGIGIARAEAIVAYRHQHGAFVNAESLRQVPGIGAMVLNRNADRWYFALDD